MENYKNKKLPHLQNITPECLPQIDADLAKLQDTLEAAEDAKKMASTRRFHHQNYGQTARPQTQP